MKPASLQVPCALTLALAAAACSVEPAPTLAISHVAVVDVIRGSVSSNQTVLIAGDRIVAVGAVGRVRVPDGAHVVDGSGGYLLPGLIDMHVHTLWDASVPPIFLPLFVANGVTTVRDMGGTLDLLRAYRGSSAARPFPAPRVIAAGAILDGPEPVHPDISIPIATVEDAVAAVDSVATIGADFVKVYTLLSGDAFESVMAEAAERGLPVAGHVPYEVGPVAAAEAGMRTIEHLMSELGGFCAAEAPASCDAVVAAFRENGTWQVPTLVTQGQTPASTLCGDPRLRYLPPAVRTYWFDGALIPPGCDPAFRAPSPFNPQLPAEGRLARLLNDAGVPLLAGTDAGVPFALPGWSMHDELHLLVEAGLRPSEALRAATWEAARALDLDHELGAIRTGYIADLLLLSENPLEDISNTRHVEAVVLNGRWFGRDRLDDVLANVAQSVEEQLPAHGS